MRISHIESYSALLHIRRTARRRDVLIVGGMFLVFSLGTFALGLLGGMSGRSVYVVSAMLIVFGVAFVAAWVRLEIAKALIEFADTVQRAATDPLDENETPMS